LDVHTQKFSIYRYIHTVCTQNENESAENKNDDNVCQMSAILVEIINDKIYQEKRCTNASWAVQFQREGHSLNQATTTRLSAVYGKRIADVVFILLDSITESNSYSLQAMKIAQVVLLLALFGRTNARLNTADGVEQDQRGLENGDGNTGNGNGNNGNGNGNGGGVGVISNTDDTGGPSQITESRPLELQVDPPPPVVSDFAAGNDDDEVNVLITYKNSNGKAKAAANGNGKAKKITQDLRLGNILAMTASKQEIRELAKDADIE
jgi:hypothetical protein